MLLTGCGGRTGSTEQIAPCISPSGTYLATFRNRAPEAPGACGSLPPYVLNQNNGYGTTVPKDTTCASQTESGSPPAMCIVRLIDCTTTTKALTVTVTEELSWSPDGGGGTGTTTQTWVSAAGSCMSTYDVVITMQ